MLLQLTSAGDESPVNLSADRVEIPLVAPDQRQWKVIILDAEDTFDVIIQKPDNEREAVFTLIKDEAAEERVTCAACDSQDTYYDQAQGYICNNCGASDDEERYAS